jgi:hypothetical protein
MFLHPYVPVGKPSDGILYKAILKFIGATGSAFHILYPIIAFSLLFVQAILLTRFINSQKIVYRPSYLPGMAYLLITSLLPEWNYFSAPLIINTLLLVVLYGLFNTYYKEKASGTIFNMGLTIGIASFIFFPAITFLFWILVAMMLMRPFRLNEWLLCLVGIAAPFYFYAVFLFLRGQLNWNEILPPLTVGLPTVKQSLWLAIASIFLVGPFLLGSYYVQDNLRRMLIQARKGWSLLLLFLFGAIFIPFVNTNNTLENWVMAAIPFAAFHTCSYLYPKAKWLPVAIFWSSVIYILYYQYAGPGWMQ